MSTYLQHPSSFRDPSGFVFEMDGKLYRQVNHSYAEDYDQLMSSGLYAKLTSDALLIPHKEIPVNLTGSPVYYKTIQPQHIPFISYSYEWCFAQLKDAALLTLNIMSIALEKGMILKDATPFNIQFISGKAIFIDSLSFEKYDETKPWKAYRQFCECFLFPLSIASYTGMNVRHIFTAYPDGIPAAITASLLPWKAKFNIGNWLHIYMPASFKSGNSKQKVRFSRVKLDRIIGHLQGIIQNISPYQKASAWSNYYNESILSNEYLEHKKSIVKSFIDKADAGSAIDLGSNDGAFSNILADKKIPVIAIDADENSISTLYSHANKSQKDILPLCIDITNPSSASGWNNDERPSFFRRVNADIVLALALIHHLCIGKNLSLERLAEFLSFTNKYLVIEFVPKEDVKVQQMLSGREDVFYAYSQANFEKIFAGRFIIEKAENVPGTARILYLMTKRISNIL